MLFTMPATSKPMCLNSRAPSLDMAWCARCSGIFSSSARREGHLIVPVQLSFSSFGWFQVVSQAELVQVERTVRSRKQRQ
jgi:hypothetical protein